VTDEITLTIPRAPGYEGVAHLVLSGLAVRLNLTIENLEDLQIALEALLETAPDGDEVTVAMRVLDGELETVVGPVSARLLDEIERDGDGNDLGLRRVLTSTVDDVHVDGSHVRLTKKVTAVDG
jgi:anti-sigma regulatory factor (Ser/Thr protein kinase)